MIYLISPPEETEWSMDPSEFVTRLKARWPDAEMRWLDADPTYVLDFTLQADDEPLRGMLAKHGKSLSIDARDDRGFAQFAEWFRKQVPSEQPLLCADETYSEYIALEPDITAEEITTQFQDIVERLRQA